MVQVEITRKQKTSRPDDVWPGMWKFMSDAARKKAKQRWAIEKPQLDNARKLRGISSVEQTDEEFKLTMKAARRNLEVPMPAAVPCKIPMKSSGESHRSIGKRKTKYACVADADESTRPRLGRKVHFSSLMDLCHLKNSNLEPQYQKDKGRIVLRGDIVKDDSGS